MGCCLKNAAAGRSATATVAALCVQLYCCLSDALMMWSACGAYHVSTWSSQKNAGALAWVCMRGFFVQRTTASHSASICASAIQDMTLLVLE